MGPSDREDQHPARPPDAKPSSQAAVVATDSGTRVLRLPTMRRRFEEIAAAAQREQLSYLDFLAEVVMAPRCRFPSR